jgi:hypothetical protein
MKEGVVLFALFGWGTSKCDAAYIEREMQYINNMFKNDACSTTEIQVPCTKEKARSFGIPTNWHSYHIIQ